LLRQRDGIEAACLYDKIALIPQFAEVGLLVRQYRIALSLQGFEGGNIIEKLGK
jgi:hypothetical protein